MATRAAESRTRRYDPAETRQRILDAANSLFSSKGFISTGTADIARLADVSEGSIFYHFGSKTNLLIELGRRYGEQMIAAMQLPGEDIADVTPEISIRRCFDFVVANKQWEQMSNGECDGSDERDFHHPEAEPFYQASRDVVIDWVERQITAAFERQGATGVNAQMRASFTYAVVHDAMHRAFRPGVTPEEREAVCAETIAFVSAANRIG